jgi:hypothetical protein
LRPGGRGRKVPFSARHGAAINDKIDQAGNPSDE